MLEFTSSYIYLSCTDHFYLLRLQHSVFTNLDTDTVTASFRIPQTDSPRYTDGLTSCWAQALPVTARTSQRGHIVSPSRGSEPETKSTQAQNTNISKCLRATWNSVSHCSASSIIIIYDYIMIIYLCTIHTQHASTGYKQGTYPKPLQCCQFGPRSTTVVKAIQRSFKIKTESSH